MTIKWNINEHDSRRILIIRTPVTRKCAGENSHTRLLHLEPLSLAKINKLINQYSRHSKYSHQSKYIIYKFIVTCYNNICGPRPRECSIGKCSQFFFFFFLTNIKGDWTTWTESQPLTPLLKLNDVTVMPRQSKPRQRRCKLKKQHPSPR